MDIFKNVYFLLWVLIVLFLFFFVVRLIRRFYHFPIPSFFASFIDNHVRRKIQYPEEIAKRLHTQSGLKVVEIGPGPGTFTTTVGRKLTPGGTLIACDISPKMIRKLRQKMMKERVDNIAPVVANASNLSFFDRTVDRVFRVVVLAEIPGRRRALREFARILKFIGFLSISEFISDPDYPLKRTVTRWCLDVAFEELSRFGGLVEYTLNFRLKEPS